MQLTFGEKLKYLMKEWGVSNKAMAEALHVDPALVSMWRGNKRRMDGDTARALAGFLLDGPAPAARREWLVEQLADSGGVGTEQLIAWLGNGKPPVGPVSDPEQAGICLLDAAGFAKGVALLAARCRTGEEHAVCVYISSEQVRLVAHPDADGIWETLRAIAGGPVPVYLELAQDSGRMAALVEILLPHLRAGRLQLHYISSSQRLFCYHVTVLVRKVGLVMATEAATAREQSVSMLVDSAAFVDTMDQVLAGLRGMAKPLVRILDGAGEADDAIWQCHHGGRDLSARFGEINLLYASPEAYRALLKTNGLDYDARRYRLNKFKAQKAHFEQFLERGLYREIISLKAINHLEEGSLGMISGLDFLQTVDPVVPEGFVPDLLAGMREYLLRYPRLQMMLVPGEEGRESLRLKEGEFLIWQQVVRGETASTKTDSWPLMLEYMKRFDARWQSGDGITGKSNVLYTLNRRISRWEEDTDEAAI